MRVQRLVTNETCNQNCAFCHARRPAERAEYVARAAVRQRLVAAQAGGPEEIVLTGGEPTLRSDLADLVRRAAAGGARVVLETNAALLDTARAAALAAAGLHTARVQLVAWGDAADAITRDPGGFDAALRGMRALAAAGVTVEVSTPIVAANAALVAALPGGIAAAALPVAALVVVVPHEAPAPAQCAPLEVVAGAIVALADAARRSGLPVRLDTATAVPPCLFPQPERVAHLFALNRGGGQRPGWTQVDACAACLVRDRCPGLPVGAQARGLPPLHPVRDQRLRRRVTYVSSVADQIARELHTRDVVRRPGEAAVVEHTVRVNFHCNQACEFCFVSTHLPPATDDAVRAVIAAAGREAAVLVLSGGEPTLNPRLVEYVRLARAAGVHTIELQSNATRLAERGLAAALAAAGLDRAMISLHGSTAETSDRITGAPGTFAATVRGIDALVATGIQVRLNFVFCQENRDDFPRFVALVAARWPRAGIVFSFVGSHTDVVPRTRALIPRFTDILPALHAGLARAGDAGLLVSGFDSMCGLPLCLVPDDRRDDFLAGASDGDDGDGEFVRGPACAQCAATGRCYGVRRGYAELYGTGELRALPGDLAAAGVAS